jgi:hypothetical protein
MRGLALKSFVFAFLSIAAIAQSQPAVPDYEAYLGTWTAQFKGKPFVTLKLVSKDGTLAGTMTGATVRFNKDGSLSEATPKDTQHDVVDPLIHDGQLYFKTKELDKPPVGFQMKLTGANSGELKLIVPGLPAGSADVQPWKIERQPEEKK